MTKRLLAACFLFFFTMGSASAVEIAWMQVQHRAYGKERYFSRLGFGLIDSGGNYVADSGSISEVKLYGPEKKELKLLQIRFDSVEEIFGTYDSKNSQWHYNIIWQYDSWFSTAILDPLQPGMYRLEVKTVDGKTAERTFVFHRHVALPVVDSDSFQLDQDSYGNMIWTWGIPDELGHLSLNHKMRARAAIEIFRNQDYTGYFSIILPVHLGYLVIPETVVELMNKRGNRFELRIYLETRDKNNRTYSEPLLVQGNLPPV